MAQVFLGLGLSSGDAIKPTEHVLGGRRYRIELTWYGRASAWLLDLRSSDGTLLLAGIAVRVGQVLTRPHVGDALPGEGFGKLMAIDTSNAGTDPGRDDLGTRVKLAYEDP